MTKIRIIGDLHLDDRYPGQLEAQIKALDALSRPCNKLVLLGDVFNKRNPSPKVLLAFNDFVENNWDRILISILRGNHDSQTKADDGITALSLFRDRISVYEHTSITPFFSYIPHYEDEKKIISDLKKISEKAKDSICFGHFGFAGCLNSTGYSDFNIPLDLFTNKTYLGHIHNFNNSHEKVTIVGTPWSTSFTESGKQSYVIDLEYHVSPEINPIKEKIVKVDFGPRFLTVDLHELKDKKDFIEDPKYHTMLRVLISSFDPKNNSSLYDELLNTIKVPYLETQIKWQIDSNTEVSDYVPDKKLLDISDQIIEDYVRDNKTGLSYPKLMQGFETLKDAIKLSKDT